MIPCSFFDFINIFLYNFFVMLFVVPKQEGDLVGVCARPIPKK